MNPAIKTQWVAALRSGEYQQGRNFLRTDEGFCCLGVLCDLAAKASIGVYWSEPTAAPTLDGRVYDDVQACCDSTGLLPAAVMCWAELDTDSPEVAAFNGLNIDLIPDNCDEIPLTQLNDTHLFDFLMIADLIEAQL
jgi:hypothetical protein